MVELKNYVDIFEDIPRMERLMISFSKYNRSRGGGILWIIFYALLYIFSLYGMILTFNYSVSNIVKSLGFVLFIIVGFFLFLMAGIFLAWGVRHQMSVMNNWHRQQFNDFKKMIDVKAHELMDKTVRDYPIKSPLGLPWQAEMRDLNVSLRDFESWYFPKKEKMQNSE